MVLTLGLPGQHWVSLGFLSPAEGHWGSRLGWGCVHLLTCLQTMACCEGTPSAVFPLFHVSQIVADYCRQGYLDALRFLERRGR